MSLESIILGDEEMFGFGKKKKTDLDMAKAHLDERFIQILNNIKQNNPSLTENEALRIAYKEFEKLPKDPSRRDAMKKAAGIAAAAVIPGLYSREVKASRDELPPGIANAREWKGATDVIYAYNYIHYNDYTCGPFSKSQIVFSMLNFGGKCLPHVDRFVAMVEPAFWYLVAETNKYGFGNENFLEEEVKKNLRTCIILLWELNFSLIIGNVKNILIFIFLELKKNF